MGPVTGPGNGARRAAGDEVGQVSEVLAEAFADYPWTRWTVDPSDHRWRIQELQRTVLDELAVPYGEVWVASTENAGIVSAAIWMLPGVPVPAAVMSSVAAASAVLEGTHHGRAVEAERAVSHLRPTRPHYFLGTVGTLPAHQGMGRGSAVLRPVLDRARAERVDAYLETSARANVAFYEGLGFRAVGEVVTPGGGPTVWAMFRSGA